MSEKTDIKSRKWLITINNPLDHGLNRDAIKLALSNLKSIEYFCIAEEIGLESKTPHLHLFVYSQAPLRFSTLKRAFPDAHMDRANGTVKENRDYVSKSGKWENDAKSDTRIEGSFDEYGKMPDEPGQGSRTDIAQIYSDIADGLSNAEIMAKNPDTALHIGLMDKVRLDILEDRYRTQFRVLTVTYLFGPTETGKTRSVMESAGYGNIYRVTDYNHSFDRYSCEDVLCLDEFRSSLPLGDMLNYLDGYPLNLPARYANRVACYTTVYIISNIDLTAQYPVAQSSEVATWKAFLRRIGKVIEFRKDGPPIDHGNAADYVLHKDPIWLKDAESAEEVPDKNHAGPDIAATQDKLPLKINY